MKNNLLLSTMIWAIAMLSLPVHNVEAAPEHNRVYLSKEKGKAVVRDVESNKLFANKDAQLSLEHAMKIAKTVMVTEGNYQCYNRVEVPRSNITLVIGQEATVRPAEDVDLSEWRVLIDVNDRVFRQLIYNKQYDHVRIINLGTLIPPPGRKGPNPNTFGGKDYGSGTSIWFDGRTSRIKGGLVFSPGTIKGAPDGQGHGVGVHNADAVRIPFVYSDGMGHATLWMEGTRGCSVGTVINEQKGEGILVEGETVDLNAHNKYTVLNNVIGLGTATGKTGDEVLDINASPNTLVNQLVSSADTREADKVDMVFISQNAGERWADGPDTSEGTKIGEKVIVSDLKESRLNVDGPGNLRNVGEQLDVFAQFVITSKKGRTLKYGGSQTISLAD